MDPFGRSHRFHNYTVKKLGRSESKPSKKDANSTHDPSQSIDSFPIKASFLHRKKENKKKSSTWMSQNCHSPIPNCECQVALTVGNRENQYLDVFHQDLIHRALESWSRAPQVARLKKHWQHWRWRLWGKGRRESLCEFLYARILPLANLLQLHVEKKTSGATFFWARRSQDVPPASPTSQGPLFERSWCELQCVQSSGWLCW